jgi:hypothetical protein
MIIPPACLETRKFIEADPLDLPAGAEAHILECPACSETRVAWLALEEAPAVQAPAGYFDHLPGRILRKLPARRTPHRALLWALAATLLAAVGTGGFLLGRANRQPLVEATLAPAPALAPAGAVPETPFQEADDPMTQVPKLSREEATALLDRLEAPSEPAPAKKP